ncbi:MAG TPA: hypothetical protein VHO48_10785, partial [Anaerolineaceae bacterium]|nr:hypothetical protein [Anaerolineaceae bacterium]
KLWYGANPTRELRNHPIVLVSEANYSKVEPIMGNDFYEFDYFRLWWPMQQYYSLKWEDISNEWAQDQTTLRGVQVSPSEMTVLNYIPQAWKHISPFFTDAQVRQAVWQIWLNTDYTQWAALKNDSTLTQTNWSPSNRIRMYVRKDLVGQIWNYGAPAVEIAPDPYESCRDAGHPLP